MEVILRSDIDKLGRQGDVVRVTEGYGRNYLVPKGFAMPVTAGNKALIAREKKAYAERLADERARFVEIAERIDALRFVAPRKVGDNDVLYGSVTSADVADFLTGKGIEIDKRKVHLEEPIKALGNHTVTIRLYADVEATLKVTVSKEG
jgi:large subunit ribosomal protein L9